MNRAAPTILKIQARSMRLDLRRAANRATCLLGRHRLEQSQQRQHVLDVRDPLLDTARLAQIHVESAQPLAREHLLVMDEHREFLRRANLEQERRALSLFDDAPCRRLAVTRAQMRLRRRARGLPRITTRSLLATATRGNDQDHRDELERHITTGTAGAAWPRSRRRLRLLRRRRSLVS